MSEDNTWYSLVDNNNAMEPPYDEWVETKGGNMDESIVRDYFSSSIGDWIHNHGDPTHWRKIV